jgi:hypothetical protein
MQCGGCSLFRPGSSLDTCGRDGSPVQAGNKCRFSFEQRTGIVTRKSLGKPARLHAKSNSKKGAGS